MFAYAMMRLRDRHAAEDLVQETLLAALSASDRFERQASTRTWLIGAGLAAAGGVFLGMDTQLNPNMGWNLLLPVFAAAILGGIGRPYGAIAGGMVIGLAEELSAYPWITDAPLLSPGYKTAVAFALMVAMLIWRPSGLFKGRVF